jgi:MscS family membrane protein
VGDIVLLNNRLDQILVALLMIALGWLVARLICSVFLNYAARWATKTKGKFDDFLIVIARNTLSFVIVILAFGYATKILTLTDGIDLFISKAILILLSLKITASFIKVFDFMVAEYLVPYANKNKVLDKTIIPTLERFMKVIIWATVILMIVSNLGYDVTSLVAGLGIGGLAFALAAQDALGNLIGSISLFADKTFRVGDFIKTPEFEGTVKAVGLRSTRFESTEGTEIIFPNKRLADIKIENLSRRPKRRVDLVLNFTYDTSSAKLKSAMKLLQEIVKLNKETDAHSRVHFSAFGDSALMVSLTYWIKTLDYEKGLKVQNDINCKIKVALEKAKIEMAFPTRTLHMK